MKKLKKISLIILIPIILGVILFIIGNVTKNNNLIYIGGIVLTIIYPATMFITVVICLILMITGKLDDNSPKENNEDLDEREIDEREEELSDLEDINTSYNYNNKMKQGEYYIKHVSNNYKNSTTKEKILGWLFFGFLMTDFALILVFAFLKIMIGALICFCLFGGTILLTILICVIIQKISMSTRIDKSKIKEFLSGEVKACVLSSTTSTGGRYTTRITKVVYKVIINANGKSYTAYSKNFYNTGDLVIFAVRKKHLATIVDDENHKQEIEDKINNINENLFE